MAHFLPDLKLSVECCKTNNALWKEYVETEEDMKVYKATNPEDSIKDIEVNESIKV